MFSLYWVEQRIIRLVTKESGAERWALARCTSRPHHKHLACAKLLAGAQPAVQ